MYDILKYAALVIAVLGTIILLCYKSKNDNKINKK